MFDDRYSKFRDTILGYIPSKLKNVRIRNFKLILLLAKRAGLDMKTFWDCIRASAGNSFVWETGGPMVMQGTYDPSFTIDLQSKDNQLGYDMAKKYKVISYHILSKYQIVMISIVYCQRVFLTRFIFRFH